MGSMINKLVETRKKWSELSVKNNKKFLCKLGKNGADTVTDRIDSLLIA